MLSLLAMCGKLFSAISMSSVTSILLSDSVLSSWIESSFRTSDEVVSQGNIHLLLQCTIQSFPISTRALGTMTSADFSRQTLLRHRTSNDSFSPMRP